MNKPETLEIVGIQDKDKQNTFCTDTRKHAEKLLIFSETTWNLLSFQVVT
jgi:hypothetical protein